MLTDIHSICGYLIGKCFFYSFFPSPLSLETFLKNVPFSQNSFSQSLFSIMDNSSVHLSKMMEKIPSSYLSDSLHKTISSILPSLFSEGSHISDDSYYYYGRFIFISVLLANSPDIDVLFGPFLGGHHKFHRSATHSIYINIGLVTTYSVFVSSLLGISFARSLSLTSCCIWSHLWTDFITNYGTKLLWPIDESNYTLGTITVFDFPSIICFYGPFFFTLTNLLSPLNAIISSTTSLSLYLIWRRGLLLNAVRTLKESNETFSQLSNPPHTPSFLIPHTNHKSESKETLPSSLNPSTTDYIWLHPSNSIPTLFYLMKYSHENGPSIEKNIFVSPFVSSRTIFESLSPNFLSYRGISGSRALSLTSYSKTPTKNFFQTMFYDTVPTFSLLGMISLGGILLSVSSLYNN